MRRLTLLLLPLLASCNTIARDETPFIDSGPERDRATAAEVIAARQAMMHMAATLLFQEVMPVARNGGDVKAAAHAADGLDLFGHSIAGLFPDGSEGPDSRALPSVWTNKADFQAKATAFGDSAARLKQLADAGDEAGFKAQAAVVASGCNACHSLYRSEGSHH